MVKASSQWMNQLDECGGADYASAVLEYIMNGMEKGEKQLFLEKAEACLHENLRSEVMTIAQQIKREGMQQEKLSIAAKLLETGMPIAKVKQMKGLSLGMVMKLSKSMVVKS